MAELNLKYYNNVDSYSDGDVEVDILNFVKEGLNVTQIPKNKRNYACAYHLSAWRENIINWYPLKKTDRVLEIGAGCGAVTGALCRNAGSVVSVELSKRRAEINYERHKDYDNLEIMVGKDGIYTISRRSSTHLLHQRIPGKQFNIHQIGKAHTADAADQPSILLRAASPRAAAIASASA